MNLPSHLQAIATSRTAMVTLIRAGFHIEFAPPPAPELTPEEKAQRRHEAAIKAVRQRWAGRTILKEQVGSSRIAQAQ